MRFIAPVTLLNNETELMPWREFDLSPYIPVTSNLVLVEFKGTVKGRTEEHYQQQKFARLAGKAHGDPHLLRQFTVVEIAPAGETDLVTIAGQALLPVGEGMSFDLAIENLPFDLGITLKVIAFFEECPTTGVVA